MSQKQVKTLKKHTVKEVLQSIHWDIKSGTEGEPSKLMLVSDLDDEYTFITINLNAINGTPK